MKENHCPNASYQGPVLNLYVLNLYVLERNPSFPGQELVLYHNLVEITC